MASAMPVISIKLMVLTSEVDLSMEMISLLYAGKA
jgi:hypothetical protein